MTDIFDLFPEDKEDKKTKKAKKDFSNSVRNTDKPFNERLNDDLSKYTLREIQEKAHQFIEETMEMDKNIKYFLMEMPVGSGKSLFAINFVKWFINNIDRTAKFDLITNSKILQQQYFSEFSSISNLWGKDNYSCEHYNSSCKEGKEFAKLNKTTCQNCPYDQEKGKYMKGEISLTNFQMFDIFQIFATELFAQREDNRVLIIDEAHDFEEVFSSFISVTMSPTIIKKYRLDGEGAIIKQMEKLTNITETIHFLKFNLVKELKDKVRGLSDSMEDNKIAEDIAQYIQKINNFLAKVEVEPNNWVFEKSIGERNSVIINVLPVWSHNYIKDLVWQHYDYVIFMSGTIINKDMFCYLNGLPTAQTKMYTAESPFPIENRPIWYMPFGKMSFKEKEKSFKQFTPFLEKLIESKHANDKGIIHTHTYEFANWINRDVDNKRLQFHTSQDKLKALEKHIASKKASVLVSPSMSTGVDLKDDLSRFQVIMKIPYPSMGSDKVKKRMAEKPEWYPWMTINTIVQMCGRSIRNYNDYAVTYITDESFGDLMQWNRHMIPNDLFKCLKLVDINKVKESMKLS